MSEPTDMDAFVVALDTFRQYCEDAWQTIVDALQPLLDFMARTWREMCAMLHTPRQYRDTIARRKIRRYAVMYARLR